MSLVNVTSHRKKGNTILVQFLYFKLSLIIEKFIWSNISKTYVVTVWVKPSNMKPWC